MKEVHTSYFIEWKSAICDPPAISLWWITDGPQVAWRELLACRSATPCCHCSSAALCLRTDISDVQLCRIWNQYWRSAPSCWWNRCEWQSDATSPWRFKSKTTDCGLQSLEQLQICIQTSQLWPAIKQNLSIKWVGFKLYLNILHLWESLETHLAGNF